MLSTTTYASKSTQIYPKTISLRNFEILPKVEILVFFNKKKHFHV
jgi:hypothetical protein